MIQRYLSICLLIVFCMLLNGTLPVPLMVLGQSATSPRIRTIEVVYGDAVHDYIRRLDVDRVSVPLDAYQEGWQEWLAYIAIDNPIEANYPCITTERLQLSNSNNQAIEIVDTGEYVRPAVLWVSDAIYGLPWQVCSGGSASAYIIGAIPQNQQVSYGTITFDIERNNEVFTVDFTSTSQATFPIPLGSAADFTESVTLSRPNEWEITLAAMSITQSESEEAEQINLRVSLTNNGGYNLGELRLMAIDNLGRYYDDHEFAVLSNVAPGLTRTNDVNLWSPSPRGTRAEEVTRAYIMVFLEQSSGGFILAGTFFAAFPALLGDETLSPEPTTYIVQAGDTPFSIAEMFELSVEELLTVNNMTEAEAALLEVGDILIISTSSEAVDDPVDSTLQMDEHFDRLTAIASAMIDIPSATNFQMGTTINEAVVAVDECVADGGLCSLSYIEDSIPQHAVSISSFQIEETEVNNLQYIAFLNTLGLDSHRMGCLNNPCIQTIKENQTSSLSFDGQVYDVNVDAANLPVTHVTWYGAQAYCEAIGRRLPTEAEWERATRGDDGRIFPWGDEWDSGFANTSRRGVEGLAPINAYSNGTNIYGVMNLAGNVSEWVYDWYAADFYRQSEAALFDTQGPATGTTRVHRGGSWNMRPFYARTMQRMDADPLTATNEIGFRCAADMNVITDVGAALNVNDVDGCPTHLETIISLDSPRIYVTGRIHNARMDTMVSVRWYSDEGQEIDLGSFTLHEDIDEMCIWFYLDTSAVDLSAGDWQFQFFIDGIPVEPIGIFTLF